MSQELENALGRLVGLGGLDERIFSEIARPAASSPARLILLPERTGPLPGILPFYGNFCAKRGTGASLPSLSASGIM